MPRIAFRVLLATFAYALVCATCLAQQPVITADLHPWGRFDPGAWKLVRVVSETLDEKGQVVSTTTTDTKTTLMNIDDEGVTLEVQVCIEVAGKKFQAEPQTVKQTFNGELAAAVSTVKQLDDEQIVVDQQKIVCRLQQVEISAANEKTVVNIYYSSDVPPYVLKRVSIVRDAENGNELSSTVCEVIATKMPVRLRGEIHSGAYVRTDHKNSTGTTTTLAVVLPDVPGGVFQHSSKEVDKQGRIVRRSTLELVDYGAEPEEDRVGVFLRKRAARRAARAISRRGQ